MLNFSWDERKASKNLRKHKVSFEESKTAFEDEFAFVVDDPEHSEIENREILTGMSALTRVLVVVYCERNAGNTIRIISARKATKRESRYYNSRRSR